MKRDLRAMIMPGDPVMLEAIDALRRYHEAVDAGESVADIERLRLIAEEQFQSINDYQLAAMGHQALQRH